jgi:hypothetical protein
MTKHINRLRQLLEQVKPREEHVTAPDVYARLTYDPWQNESIEYALSGDEDQALEALNVDVDVYHFMHTLKQRGVVVEEYQVQHHRHTGTRWRVCATFREAQWHAWLWRKHPYITVEIAPWS